MLARAALVFLLCLTTVRAETAKEQFLAGAAAQIGVTRSYDPAYTVLAYPGGDVPEDRGVCTDVVIRAFRKAGLDLQKVVHEDMTRAFSAYPKLWGLRAPDTNIDHRRVPNLMAWFQRQGKAQPISRDAKDYAPGDVVAWRLPDGRPHIGLVSDRPAGEPGRYRVIHNIGSGAQAEDRLFDFEIIGHYRYW